MGEHHTDVAGDQENNSPAVALAREWARAVVTASYVPMSPPDVRHYLQDLATRLLSALSGSSVDTQAASDVGTRLVAGGFIGAQSLPRTFEVLGKALPAAAASAAPGNPRPSCGRIITLLGALAAGYTWALRSRVMDEQEEIKRALSLAWQDVERNLRVSEAQFREVFDSSPVGIAISEPSGLIVRTNRSLDETLGYSPGELPGRHLGELFSATDRPIMEERYQGLVTGQASRYRVRTALRCADGGNAWANLAASVLPHAEPAHHCLITVVDDITDLHLLGQRLNYQSLHDLQTGLPNRQYLLTHLEKVLALRAPSAVVTLLHLDLDGFSAITDGLGYQAGDQLLDVVARRLEAVVADRPAMVARLGNDEYAILIEPVNTEFGDPVPDPGALAESINTTLAEPFTADGIGVRVTATIGVVQRRVAEAQPDELMRDASTTLRRIRGRGTRQWTLSDPDSDVNPDTADRVQLRLAATLPSALETGELHVTYQPVVTLEGQRLVGIEAALSWRHPQLGELSGEHCGQLAERTGVAHEVSQWLLRTAAEQALSWRQCIGGSVPPVVVNLTPSQAQDPGLVPRVSAVLAWTGLTPAALELRAPPAAIRTDTGELADAGGRHAEDNVRMLTTLGVRAGLYDFGGGIGALRCLADLPVRTVRIAQPVSQQVANDPSRILSQAAQALVHIVRAAGIDVVAFPVDSAEQAACWPWIGANWAVGALFGTPGPPVSLEPWLDAYR